MTLDGKDNGGLFIGSYGCERRQTWAGTMARTREEKVNEESQGHSTERLLEGNGTCLRVSMRSFPTCPDREISDPLPLREKNKPTAFGGFVIYRISAFNSDFKGNYVY